MNDHKKADIRRDRREGMGFYELTKKYGVDRNLLRDILGLPPVAGDGKYNGITPEVVLAAVVEAKGNRAKAAKALGISTDIVHKRLAKCREMGIECPDSLTAEEYQEALAERLQPGEWCEYSQSGQETRGAVVVKIDGKKSRIRFSDNSTKWVLNRTLTWVPAPDVIAQECRKIQSQWLPQEFARRAPHAHVGEYEIPQWQTGDMSADCVW